MNNWIRYNPDTKVFTLETKNSSYQMQVRELGILVHLYYGANIGDSEITDQIVLLDRGFSPNPPDAGRIRTYSLDSLPQEYSAAGNGDYRCCALDVKWDDGSRTADLRYSAHRILQGKYSLEGLPAMFAPEDEAMTLEIDLRDTVGDLQVTLLYGVLWDRDVITRAVLVKNTGNACVRLEKAGSAQLDFLHRPMDVIHFHGRHLMERIPERRTLDHGIFTTESTRGTSSHQHNPFVIFCDPDTTEEHGDCYGIHFVYSGNFLFEAERDQFDQTRAIMGINPKQFEWLLQPGCTFTAPEVILTYAEHGFGELSCRIHKAFRKNLMRSRYTEQPRPVLFNSWEAAYFDFDADRLLRIAEAVKASGADLFVLDDGWFGKRDSDYSGLGDWIVNEEKIQGGLQALSEKIRGLGLGFGLWIEPEMVSEDSDLFRQHPDWCMRFPGREPVRGRYQLNLDMTRKEVRDHVMEQIFGIIASCGITYIKWDMNRSLGNVYSNALPADRQGETAHRYMLGVYEMMEALTKRFPDLLFENCSGGGGRFDAGMLYYSPQIWCSDNTDAVSRLSIHYGTSFGYPVSAMGAHVSVCPNHQNGRSVSVETRAVTASVGTFGYELDPGKLTEEEREQVRAQIAWFREKEPLVQKGSYYRLVSPLGGSPLAAWEFVSEDGAAVLCEGVMLDAFSNSPLRLIRLRGLDPAAHYRDKDTGREYTGQALMKAGVVVPPMEEYRAFTFAFDRI
ncbi:MAG: alpha-galactosidase [Lachnospiraceae bacterium]|nr:alpha-galactosidase [Lachnospiraceae bacterium]